MANIIIIVAIILINILDCFAKREVNTLVIKLLIVVLWCTVVIILFSLLLDILGRSST